MGLSRRREAWASACPGAQAQESRRRPRREAPEKRHLPAAPTETAAPHTISKDVKLVYFVKSQAWGPSATRAGAGCGGQATAGWLQPPGPHPLRSQGPPPCGLEMGEPETKLGDWPGTHMGSLWRVRQQPLPPTVPGS